MTASVQPLRAHSRFRASIGSPPLQAVESSMPSWRVDAQALARCRALLSGHGPVPENELPTGERQVEVPAAYESFCRNHFASVRRVRPDLEWEDARHAYGLALAAHAVLCEALDEEREHLLSMHWERLRGRSGLDWERARPLLADGCRALSRLDPLAIHR